jgi:deoxyribodipyrimidine photolyase
LGKGHFPAFIYRSEIEKIASDFLPTLDENFDFTVEEIANAKKQAGPESERFKFKGGESKALRHLNKFLFEKRQIEKFIIPPRTRADCYNTSHLSQWFTNGCLSVRFVYQEI